MVWLDGTMGIIDKLKDIDELITRTQSKPIIVEVKGDLGGVLTVDVIGGDSQRKILLNDGKFLNNLTNEIEDRIGLKDNITGK